MDREEGLALLNEQRQCPLPVKTVRLSAFRAAKRSSGNRPLEYQILNQNRHIYERNMHILSAVVDVVLLCGRHQDIPLRGHRDNNSKICSAGVSRVTFSPYWSI
jgi:hypothetical protein